MLHTLDDVRDEMREWLSLRQWSIAIERNGSGFNVQAREFPTDRKTTRNAFKVRDPLRTLAAHVAEPGDVYGWLLQHDAFRTCRCGARARVEDVDMLSAEQSFKCHDGCGHRWPA